MWLKKQQIKIVCDFDEHVHWEMQLRQDNKVLIAKNVVGNEVHRVDERNVHRRVELIDDVNEEEFRGVIARLNTRGVLKVQYEETEHREEMMPEETCGLNEKELYIRDWTLSYAAHAAYDGSKKYELFGGYCVITDAG